jgi:catechol 2,3-dioxygenase-like lactoylglutathione lyase family enzyme
MLRDSDAIATLPVRDIRTAAAFYEDIVGLERGPGRKEKQVVTYKSGNSKLLVYESQFAGTNKGTAVTWAVPDVTAVVNRLKAKGVKFERYDFPGVTHEGDVHVMGERKNAWFLDPDGNILSIVNM